MTTETKKPEAHVSEKKKQKVQEITEKIKQYPILGLINLEGLPGRQLLQIKKQLRGQIDLVVTRKKLIARGLQEGDKNKKGVANLIKEIKGIPALVFTKSNPFLLYKLVKKSKSPAAAKAGQTSPRDITIPAGPTQFTPGPIIAELGSFGIKTMVENGKITVRSDTIVVKENQIITDKLAGLLSKFGIEPMEVGLNITTMFEAGIVYPKSVLDVDEKIFMEQLMTAAKETYGLAIEISYTTKETIEPMVVKASRESKALAIEAKILADEVIGEILGQAEREMLALNAEVKLPEKTASVEEPVKEEPKLTEQPKKEEPKIEPPKQTEKPKQEKQPVKQEPAPKEEPKQEQQQKLEKPVETIVEAYKTSQKKAEELLKEAEEEIQQEKQKQPQKTQEQIEQEKRQKEVEQVEKLTQQLKKKGTLR